MTPARKGRPEGLGDLVGWRVVQLHPRRTDDGTRLQGFEGRLGGSDDRFLGIVLPVTPQTWDVYPGGGGESVRVFGLREARKHLYREKVETAHAADDPAAYGEGES